MKNDVWIEKLYLWADENNLTNLKWDESHGGYWKGLPREREKLLQLTTLNIFDNKIVKLTDNIYNLTNLTELILFDNSLVKLPDGISKLTNLTKLYLNKNQLLELPNEISNLVHLSNLSLIDNPDLILTPKQREWILKLIENGCEVKINQEILGIHSKISNNELDENVMILANLFSDYRQKDGLNPTPEIIQKWILQFSKANREVILSEMVHIFRKMYISEQNIDNFLFGLVTNNNLTNSDPNNFWRNVSLLNIQKDGYSQDVMVHKFKETIYKQLNIDVAVNDYTKRHYIYVDDFIFSGKKLRTDLSTFLEVAPYNAKIDAIYIGCFSSGEYWLKNTWLKENNSKDIQLNIWKLIELENKNNCQNNSDVLFPTNSINCSEYVDKYIKEQGQCSIRDINQKPSIYCKGNNIFSNEKNRQILEEEFTLAGLRINASIKDNSKKLFWKPLGLTSFSGLGFGAMTMTYRNCPNNTPLALWWGDWNNNSIWTPLFIRKTYRRNS